MSEALSAATGRSTLPGLRAPVPPQIHASSSTRRMMWAVFICLTPAAIFGVLLFGLSALAVLLTALAAALLTEVAVTSALGLHHTLGDGSAAVTGLLLGMSMPPGVALHVPVIASVFAIAVVKWTFGGLGKNWMNPALAGRVFVFFSFETEMTQWRLPSVLVQNSASGSADAVSGATILGLLHRGQESGSIGAPSAFLRSAEFPVSRFDERITAFLNEHLFEPVHVFLPAGYVDPFLGLIPGSIGEVSALLLLLGTVFLWSRRILRWEISFSYFLAFALCTWVFGGTVYGTGPFSGDVLLHLLSGGLVLTLFYMANDPATAPMSPTGMIIYGSIAGILTFLLRFYGSYPEGVALAVLLANVATPVIDRWTRPARFGAAREGRA